MYATINTANTSTHSSVEARIMLLLILILYYHYSSSSAPSYFELLVLYVSRFGHLGEETFRGVFGLKIA